MHTIAYKKKEQIVEHHIKNMYRMEPGIHIEICFKKIHSSMTSGNLN